MDASKAVHNITFSPTNGLISGSTNIWKQTTKPNILWDEKFPKDCKQIPIGKHHAQYEGI